MSRALFLAPLLSLFVAGATLAQGIDQVLPLGGSGEGEVTAGAPAVLDEF